MWGHASFPNLDRFSFLKTTFGVIALRFRAQSSITLSMDSVLTNVTESLKNAPHPFYPLEANVVGYLANEYSVPVLLGTFAAGCIVILGSTLALVRRQNAVLSHGDKAAILWNVLSKSRSKCAKGASIDRVYDRSWLNTYLL